MLHPTTSEIYPKGDARKLWDYGTIVRAIDPAVDLFVQTVEPENSNERWQKRIPRAPRFDLPGPIGSAGAAEAT
jgi:hypothetical protein